MDGYSPVAPIHSTVTDKVYFAVQDVLDGRKFKVFLKPTDMGKLKVQKIRRTLAQTTGYDLESIVLQSGDRTLSDEMTGVMFDLNPTTVLNMKVLQQSSRTVHPFSPITSPVHSNANGTDQRMNVSTVSGISPIKRYSVDRSPIPSVTRAFSYGRQQHGNSGNSSLSHTPKRIKSLSPRPSHQCTTRSNGTSLSDGLNSMLLNDDSNYINMKGVVRSISAITTPSNPNRVDSRSYSEKSLSARKHSTQYTGSKTRDHATAHKNPHYPGVYPTSEKKVYPNERSKDTSRSNENGEEINDPKQSHDMASLTDLETTIAQLNETNALLQLEVRKYMYQADQSMLECEKLRLTLDHIFATRLDKDENAHLKLSLQLSEEKIKNANFEKAHHILLEQLRSETKHRKKLEGILEDFEGPTHVMMRLRPVIAKESPNFAEGRVSISSEGNSIVVTTPGIGSRTFQFHHCFGEGTSTLDIFLDIKPSLRRFLDGVNSCILAYGQTNAGKSFTMLGSLCSKVESNESESTGMISYIVQDIFDALDSCDGSELEYNVSCTVLESYNEVIRDLSSGVKVEVRSLPTGVNSFGAMRHQLLDVEQSMELLSKTIAAQRPRSHLIVSIYVSIRNRSQSQSIVSQTCSTITLVDLAGCERVSRNVSNKDKVSETQSVNKSLSALGDVIAAMSQGCYPKHRLGGSSSTNSPQHNVSSASALQSITSSTFVPFRNSKLTLLLQETLQAQLCRVWWIGCIAPAALGTANLNETMATLTFSGRLLRSNR